MMTIDVKNYDLTKILDDYLKRLKNNTDIKNSGNHVIFTTPFLDSYSDFIQLLAYKKGSDIIISDDGRTIANLKMKGVDLTTGKRLKIFKQIINGFGIGCNDSDELFVISDISKIGQKKHSLIQAILAVGDMYILSRQSVFSLFKEDVENYFMLNDLYPSKNMKISGKSGYDHMIDFIFNPSKERKESLIKVISKPKKDTVMSALFTFNDIKQNKPNSDYFVILNDIEENPSEEVRHALKEYDITTKLRSKKSETLLPYFAVM